MSSEFVMGAFRDEPAWHHLGYVKENGWLNVTEAVLEVGMDFNYLTLPSTYTYNGMTFPTGRFDVVREPIPNDPNPKFIKNVSGRYDVVQNTEMAAILDPLCDYWKLDTLGVLSDGKRVFFVFDVGEYYVSGMDSEHYLSYLFVGNDFSGNGAISWYSTDIRVVCWNTFRAAQQTGILIDRISHASEPHIMLKFRADLERYVIETRQKSVAQFEAMIAQKMVENQFNELLTSVFVPPTQPRVITTAANIPVALTTEESDFIRSRAGQRGQQWEADMARVETFRKLSADEYVKFNDTYPHMAETLYAGYQAVNTTINHAPGRGSNQRKAENLLYGDRANLLLKLDNVATGMLN